MKLENGSHLSTNWQTSVEQEEHTVLKCGFVSLLISAFLNIHTRYDLTMQTEHHICLRNDLKVISWKHKTMLICEITLHKFEPCSSVRNPFYGSRQHARSFWGGEKCVFFELAILEQYWSSGASALGFLAVSRCWCFFAHARSFISATLSWREPIKVFRKKWNCTSRVSYKNIELGLRLKTCKLRSKDGYDSFKTILHY